MRSSILLALAGSLSSVAAVFQGFNYGSTKSDGSFMFESDFEGAFKNAKNLVGTSGFTSARLYTMIQGGSSTNEPTQAIQAAINQDVSLLLGLWASGGEGGMQAEITALKAAITQYGTKFTSLVAGISIGSEDLYRVSPTGIAALSGAGATPDELVHYISEVRTAIQGTGLSGAAIGHVDTWTAWVNGSNSEVAAACDWIGMDAYPYFQNSMANSIDAGKQLFNDAFAATKAAVNGKPVWVTETGWPVSGKTEGQGVPSTANAKTYWDQVGCPLFGNVNTWWFTMQDSNPVTPNPSFGLVGSTLSTTPLYDLSCNNVVSLSAATSSASDSTSTTAAGSSVHASGTTHGGSTETPTTSVASSEVASASSAATETSAVVTGGGGLSPSQGVPSLVNTSAVPTGATGSSGNGSTPVSTSTFATTKTTGTSGTGTTTSALSTNTGNAADLLSASPLVAVVGAVIAAAMAL